MISSTSNSKSAVILLLRIALLACIIIVINQLVIASLPFAWGEISFNNRFNYYKANEEDFDTIFIGSSRTYRHIDPSVFDQEMAHFSPTKSFNVGAGANFFPKTYRTHREILADKPENLKTILFEITVARLIPAPENLHTLEQVYWYDLDTTMFQFRSIWQADIDFSDKLLYASMHLGSLLEKYLNWGLGVDILSFWLTDHYAHETHLGLENNGYYPLDDEQAFGTDLAQRLLSQRRESLLENPEMFVNLVNASTNVYNDPDSWQEYNPSYLTKLQQMQGMADEAGIELIFVLQPRLGRAYNELLPLFYSLPASKRIELVDPKKYPEFYSQEYAFDQGHLNRAGAEEFTKFLAREFISLHKTK